MLRRFLAALVFLLPLAASAQLLPNAPRPGIDYEVLPSPQPTFGQGKIEVAEVFSYTCIHCAQAQPAITQWSKRKAADVRFEYVPAIFGGVADNFARAFFAAQAMGVLDKTHDAVFKAVFIEKKIRSGSLEEIADLYAGMGVDRAKFLATMNSFAVTSKLAKARQFSLRTGVNATPTFVINGKYRAVNTRDRGHDGLIATIEFLVAKERAASKKPAATTAAPAPAR
jgi:thiol:disulfide interchange protein DsbA